MLRHFVKVVPLLLASCMCEQGPGFIKDTSLSAQASQPIDLTVPLHPDGDMGHYTAVYRRDVPEGLDVRIEGEVIRMTGTLPAESYSFDLTLYEELSTGCSSWARYNVTLDVTESP